MTVLLSVVVPTTKDIGALPEALRSLGASDLPREFWELVVVDDGSTDQAVAVAAPIADTIVRIPGRSQGPAYARNRGAEAARGEILVFIDADVCVLPDALRRFAWAFLASPGLAAVSGAYIDEPETRGFVSRYRDALNHYLQVGPGGSDAGFWADCGAVRREVFFAMGMFNEWHFDRPQIEAIELGQRLKERGAVAECRTDILARHLKVWTVAGMIAADLKDRAVPRSRLASINNGVDQPAVPVREQLCVVLAWLTAAAALAGVVGLDAGFPLAAVLLGGLVWLDWPVLGLFYRRQGLPFVVGAVPLQWLHYLLSGVALMLGVLLRHSIGDPQPSAAVQAFSEVGVVKWPPVRKPRSPQTTTETGDRSKSDPG